MQDWNQANDSNLQSGIWSVAISGDNIVASSFSNDGGEVFILGPFQLMRGIQQMIVTYRVVFGM